MKEMINNLYNSIKNEQDKYIDSVNNLFERYNYSIEDSVMNEFLENSPLYKKTEEFIGNDEFDGDENDIIECLNYFLERQVSEKLDENNLKLRYENETIIYDKRDQVLTAYDELINYLDENNINYEISKSTKAGYVPSIYIKDEDGDVVLRIANHDNGYINDFDKVYDDAYNHFFNDEEYINWRENIISKIEDVI